MRARKVEPVLFVWEGLDKQGLRSHGELMARSELLAKAELRRQGMQSIKVRKKPVPLFALGPKKIKTKDIAIFSRQLATMLSSGVPLVQAFEIVGREHENPSMRNLLLEIKDDLENGNTLASALGRHPDHFDDLFCNLVRVGEHAGVLESLLNKIADYKEKTESIKGKIRKALSYPVAVVVVAFIVTAILLMFVVPQFETLFKGFGADLPAFTRMVVNLSKLVQSWWHLVLGGGVLLVVGFIQLKKHSENFRQWLDRLVLYVPVVGTLIRKAAIARITRTLSTMSAAGVPLVEALQSVSGATGNYVYTQAMMDMSEEVSTGSQLQLAMRRTALFPNMVVQMVAIGEEAGALDSMLSKVADFYEEEVDVAVDSLSSLIEPMIMAILGVVVGGLVIAMYLPIFKLGSVV